MNMLSEYYSVDEKRKAVLYNTLQGFEIELIEDGVIKERRELHNHNLYYAEDACENWIEGIM